MLIITYLEKRKMFKIFKMLKREWASILLVIFATLLCVFQIYCLKGLKDNAISYKEKYEEAISQKDFLEKRLNYEHSFEFESDLSDNSTVRIKVDYAEKYLMSVEQRHRMTILIKEALANKKAIPAK